MGAAPKPTESSRDSEPLSNTATQRADRRWHRALAQGILLAVAFHAALLLMFRANTILPTPFSAAGPRMGDIRAAAGGGGEGLTMVEVREQRTTPAEEVPVPVPVPVPEEVVVEPERPPAPEVAREEAPVTLPGAGGAGQGGQSGTAAGPGTATGTGSGGGGTEEEGQSGLTPPTPRGLFIPPPNPPRSAKGKEITVWVFVTEQGRVAPDSTRLEPPTSDARYNQRLRRSAQEWVFDPARRNGRAVGTWFPFWIIL